MFDKKKLCLFVSMAFFCLHSSAKDIYHFDLKDYGLYWGMSEERFEELCKTDKRLSSDFRYYIEFRDDKGIPYVNSMTYFENNNLCQIKFLLKAIEIKNQKKSNEPPKSFFQDYYEKIEEVRRVYGQEIKTNIHCFNFPDTKDPEKKEEIINIITWWDHQDTKIVLSIEVTNDRYKIDITFASIDCLVKYNPSSELLSKQ